MVVTNLRISEDLYNKIVELSLEEERSINSQILYILKKYIEDRENNK